MGKFECSITPFCRRGRCISPFKNILMKDEGRMGRGKHSLFKHFITYGIFRVKIIGDHDCPCEEGRFFPSLADPMKGFHSIGEFLPLLMYCRQKVL